MTVSILEAKQNLEALLDKAEAGESVVITLRTENLRLNPRNAVCLVV